jgi:hypothetical protein
MHQGLGLRKLFDIQGINGIVTFIQVVNAKGSANLMLLATLQALQIEAGIGENTFKQNKPLPYVNWSWLMSIRNFLDHINAFIKGVPITVYLHAELMTSIKWSQYPVTNSPSRK